MDSLQVSALLLFALVAIVLVKERTLASVSLAGGLLAVALIQVFDHLALRDTQALFAYKRAVLSLTALMPGCFLLYSDAYRRRSHAGFSYAPLAVLVLIGAAFTLSTVVLPLEYFFPAEAGSGGQTVPLGTVGYWFYLAMMIFCAAALVSLEAVFVSIRGADRWRVKYEFFGVGSILGVFIFHLSQGFLYRSEDLGLLSVRSWVLVAAALLVAFSRIYRGKSQRVVVSRTVFYRSFTLLAVATYLLALGLAAQVMRSFQISLSRDLLLLVSFASGLAFLALVFSEDIRRRVKILASKHFYAQKHDYREQWLSLSNALASCRGIADVQEAAAEAYRRIFGLHFTALYACRGGESPALLAARLGGEGLPGRLPISRGLSRYFVETARVMNPLDGEYTLTEEEAEFCRAAKAWLLVPLLASDNLEAVALLGGQIVPERLTYEDYDLMKLIGRQAALSLNNLRLSEELAEAREMAAMTKVATFVIHDLKNLAYTFSLMMQNADDHIDEPEFQRDLVRSIRGTVAKMNGLITKLKTVPERTELKPEDADLARLVQETVDEARGLKPAVEFVTELAPAAASVDLQEFRKVVLNLLLNACDAVADNGRLHLRTDSGDDGVRLAVEDNGCGMSADFVQTALFKPFRTTKQKGLGIGLYQCRQIVEAHGGRIEVASREGEGTVFTVVLPRPGQR